jgi:signal transduction histidine kinase
LAVGELEAAGLPADAVDVQVVGDSDEAGQVMGEWDEDRLVQLVSNLASNALAHGTPGTRVCIRLGGTTAHATLDVENAGVVPDDLLPSLFHPLKASGERRREGSSGLGLGLYISEQIVLAHGGTIGVTSSEGRGTQISVRLPRVQKPGGQAPQ